MTVFTKAGQQIFAPVDESGNARSVSNQDVQVWSTEVEALIKAFVSGGGLIFDSKASLDADLAHDANSMAWVLGDATAANNGIYRKIGASGAGSWTRVGDLPYSFIVASDAGAGTPNAIVATSTIPVSESALILLNIHETNSGSPVTVAFNGGSALTIKTNSGEDIAVGGLVAGMVAIGVVSGSTFRLSNDEAIAALIYAARDETEEAAARVEEALSDFRSETWPLFAVKLQTTTTSGQTDYPLTAPVPAINGHLHVHVRVGNSPQPKDGAAYTIIDEGTVIHLSEDPGDDQELYVEGAALYGIAIGDSAPIVADSILIDNAAGTLRESKTFSYLRGLLGVFDTLAELQASTVRAGITTVYVAERDAGFDGGAYWTLEASEPDVPALAKTQDAAGKWFRIVPDSTGRFSPLALGARPSLCVETQTKAWFDACGMKPTRPHLRAIDNLYIKLRGAIGDRATPLVTIYSKLRELHVLRGGTSQQRLLDLIDPTKTLTSTGTITYDVLGAAGDGAASFMVGSTSLNAMAGLTKDNISIGCFAHSDGTESNDAAGLVGTVVTNSGDTFIVPKSSGLMRTRVSNATSTSGTITQTNSLGFYAVSRTNSANYLQVIDDQKPETITAASVALADGPLHIGKTATTAGTTLYNGSAVSIAFVAEGLTARELKLLYRILRDFLVQIDAALAAGGTPLTAADIDAVPYDSQPAFQAAIDLGNVFAPTPRGVKDFWYLGDEIKVPSNRVFDGTWGAKFKLMASAPAGANCIGNKDKVNGNVNISVLNCWWDWNRVNRTSDTARPGLSCIVLARVRGGKVHGNYCTSSYLHGINASSVTESYLGELNWKDGTNGSQVDQSSFDIVISENYCTDFGDDGITTHWTNRATIIGNHCWQGTGHASPGSSGIEGDDGTRYALIHGNHIWECDADDSGGISVKGHVGAPAAQFISIVGNFVDKCSRGIAANHVSGVEFNGQGIVVSSNVLKDIDKRTMWFEKCIGFICSNNTIKRVCLYDTAGAIRLTGLSSQGVISGNVIDDSGQAEFAIANEGNNFDIVITGNNIKNCLGGIDATSPDMTVTGNHIRAGTPTGGGTPSKGIDVSVSTTDGLITANNIKGFTNNLSGTAGTGSITTGNRVA